ncbi:MAG: hypothetical protein VKP57_03550 [Candidatus Sericytochromatia bacterium]|nr:hypothetical protein [Candidatus Sericytochromatia bacterium]
MPESTIIRRLAALIPFGLGVGSAWLVAVAPVWQAPAETTLAWDNQSRRIPSGMVLRGLPTGRAVRRDSGAYHWLGEAVPVSWPSGPEARATGKLRLYPAPGGYWVRTARGLPVTEGLAWWTGVGTSDSGVACITGGRLACPAAAGPRDFRLRGAGHEDRLLVQPAPSRATPADLWAWSAVGWFRSPASARTAIGTDAAATPSVTVRVPARCRQGERPQVPLAIFNPGETTLRVTLVGHVPAASLLIRSKALSVPPFSRLESSLELPELPAGRHVLAWHTEGTEAFWRTEQVLRVVADPRRFGRRAILPPGRASRLEVVMPADALPGTGRLEIVATAHAWGGFAPALQTLGRPGDLSAEARAATCIHLARLKRRASWCVLPGGWPGARPGGPGGEAWLDVQAWAALQPALGPVSPVPQRRTAVPVPFAQRAALAEALATAGVPLPPWFVASWPPPKQARDEDIVRMLRAARLWGHERATLAARRLWTRRQMEPSGTWHWQGGVIPTAEALEALLDVGVDPLALEPGFRWLEQQRVGAGWETPVHTAAVLAALASLQARQPAPPVSAAPPALWLDGAPLGPGQPSKGARRWVLAAGRLKSVSQVLEVGAAPAWASGSMTVVWQVETPGKDRPPVVLSEGSIRHGGIVVGPDLVRGTLEWETSRAQAGSRLVWSRWTGGGGVRLRLGSRQLPVRPLGGGRLEFQLPGLAAGVHRLRWEAEPGPGGHLVLPPVHWCPDPVRPRHAARTAELWLDIPARRL